MDINFENLKNKEIICVKDGYKIGYVDDLVFDSESYKIKDFVCYAKRGLFTFFSKKDDIVIPYDKVQIIGEDIILIDGYDRSNFEIKRKNKLISLFFDE